MSAASPSLPTENPASIAPSAETGDIGTDALAGVNLTTAELPTNISPAVSRWMTWSFLVLVFTVPLIQAGVEVKRRAWPQAMKLFTRVPTRRNLEVYEKRLEETSLPKQFVYRRARALVQILVSRRGSADQGERTGLQTVQDKASGNKTRFVEWLDGTGGGLVLHPFIEFTHAVGPPESELDYFGFRNPANYYFERPQGKLVVLTGNSEAMGSTHKRPIARRLEEYLNKHSSEKWHVLNLAMNGYTVPAEINAYVHLAYHLRPDFVISHSLGADMYFGLMVPTEYKKLGLYYYKPVETWYPQVRGITIQGAGKWEALPGGHELLADGYVRGAEKYRDIVRASGGRFILGLQRCDPEAGPNLKAEQRKDWYAALARYDEVRERLAGRDLDHLDFAQVAGLKCVDPIHTDDDSAQIIAETYGAHILGQSR
jgi:hypothetical protein